MNGKNKKLPRIVFAVLTVCLILALTILYVNSSSIVQNADHSAEASMYHYDIDVNLTNPCNSNDMDDDAVCEFWFDFTYRTQNGYGKAGTYRLDMSWSNNGNYNSDILRNTFIRPNDNECMTRFSVWIPGILEKVNVHLNMDGGERLSFTVTGIFLNGYRVNADTDGVSSAYLDSDAEIPCYAAKAGIYSTKGGITRDQYNGIFTAENTETAEQYAGQNDYKYYHQKKYKGN